MDQTPLAPAKPSNIFKSGNKSTKPKQKEWNEPCQGTSARLHHLLLRRPKLVSHVDGWHHFPVGVPVCWRPHLQDSTGVANDTERHVSRAMADMKYSPNNGFLRFNKTNVYLQSTVHYSISILVLRTGEKKTQHDVHQCSKHTKTSPPQKSPSPFLSLHSPGGAGRKKKDAAASRALVRCRESMARRTS